VKKQKLTLAIFAKNEESILQDSLLSVKDCVDDMVFVDTGSTDKTVSIAQKFTKNIHYFKWCDSFADARNFTESFIKDGYVMHWDADWILTKQSSTEIINLKNKNFFGNDLIFISQINTNCDSKSVDDIVKKQNFIGNLPFIIFYAKITTNI
jgi:glycosyltransferase involved in cell wall biosynthesis